MNREGDGQLLKALREDPSGIFEVESDLPSGNIMYGEAGPIINGRVAASMRFEHEPSEEDLGLAKLIMGRLMGASPALVLESRNDAEHEQSVKRIRGFFGGGEG